VMKFRLLLPVAAIGLLLGGCTNAPDTAHPTTTTTGEGRSGQSLSGVIVDGQTLSIRIYQFIDPAKDDRGYNTDSQGVAQQNDDHFATAELQITNRGNSTIATGTLSVLAYDQNGTAYSSTLSDNNDTSTGLGCASGPALDGNADLSSLSPGEAYTYCLAFILPEPDLISKIEVSGIAGSGSGYNAWDIGDYFTGWNS